MDIVNIPKAWREAQRTATAEPDTVREARALVADPAAAAAQPTAWRQVAWLVAKADLRQRRTYAAVAGGTAA